MEREYYARVRRIWAKNIAGPLALACAVILPIAGLGFHLDSTLITWLGVAPLLVAILLTWPAHYEVWKEERASREQKFVEERPKAEVVPEPVVVLRPLAAREPEAVPEPETVPKPETSKAESSTPEIQGELRGFRLSGRPGESRSGNVWRCYANAACKLYVSNSKPIQTTLKELVLDGSALDPPAEFSQVTFVRGAQQALEQGVGINCDVLLTYTFKGLQWKQIGRVDLKNVIVYAVDSFGNKHSISVAQGESLPTP